MKENIVLVNGVFWDGSTKEEHDAIGKSFHGKGIVTYMIIPGEAHIAVYDKKATD